MPNSLKSSIDGILEKVTSGPGTGRVQALWRW